MIKMNLLLFYDVCDVYEECTTSVYGDYRNYRDYETERR